MRSRRGTPPWRARSRSAACSRGGSPAARRGRYVSASGWASLRGNLVASTGERLVPASLNGRMRDPADQVPDQRFRHADVHVVVRHMVSNAICRPAERQLREVAGAHHQAVLVVGEPEQVAGALARLHVLESDVVDLAALRIGMAEVPEHLHAGGPDVDLLGARADRAHELPGARARARRGGEAGHGVGEDVLPRQAELVHHARADEQRLGRVEPARDADDQFLRAGRAQARGEPGDLDAVDLLAARLACRRVAGHIGESFDFSFDQHFPAGQLNRKFHCPGTLHFRRVSPHRLAEGVLAHAVGFQALQVPIGE